MRKWTAHKIKNRRKLEKKTKLEMATLLSMSAATYKKLEDGDKNSMERYAYRLDQYYFNGYSLTQEHTLKELGLHHLIEQKERDRTKYRKDR